MGKYKLTNKPFGAKLSKPVKPLPKPTKLDLVKQDLYGKKLTSKPFGMPKIPSSKKVKKHYKKEEKKEYKSIMRGAKEEQERKDKLNKDFFGRFQKKKTLPDKLKDKAKALMGAVSLHKYKKGTTMAN